MTISAWYFQLFGKMNHNQMIERNSFLNVKSTSKPFWWMGGFYNACKLCFPQCNRQKPINPKNPVFALVFVMTLITQIWRKKLFPLPHHPHFSVSTQLFSNCDRYICNIGIYRHIGNIGIYWYIGKLLQQYWNTFGNT